nr:monocarboxylate transporter 13-like [Lytechinus pictus]
MIDIQLFICRLGENVSRPVDTKRFVCRLGVMSPLLQVDVTLKLFIAGWIGSVSIGLTLMVAPLVNILTARFGCRRVAILGLLVSAGALIVTSFLTDILAVFFVYGLVFGGGAGILCVSCYDAVLFYFPEENNVRAMGLLLSGTSFGLLSFTPLMSFIISMYGWRTLLRILGPLLFMVGFPCVCTFGEPPPHPSDNSATVDKPGSIPQQHDTKEFEPLKGDYRILDTSKQTVSSTEQSDDFPPGKESHIDSLPVKVTEARYQRIKDMDTMASSGRCFYEPDKWTLPCTDGETGNAKVLGTSSNPNMTRRILVALTLPELWLISISMILNGMGDCFYLVNWINYMMSVGFTEMTGVRVVSVIGFANLVGKIVISAIGDYIPFPRVFLLVIANGISIVIMLLVMFTRSEVIMYGIAVVVGGVTMTTTNTISFSLSNEFFGPQRALETSGIILCTYGSGYVLGSLVGESIDKTGSYTSAIWSFIGMHLVSGLCVLMSPVYQRFFAPDRFVTYELYRKKKEARKKCSVSQKQSFDCKIGNIPLSQKIVCDRVTSV